MAKTRTVLADQIAFLGYPFEHNNLTCHSGIISSFYTSGPVNIIQLDASVNASNSGGPLIDPLSGRVLGVITLKATGLTKSFKALRAAIKGNIAAMIAAQQQGIVAEIMGVNPVKAFEVGQRQMLMTLDEIERQANVGIGYAFSIEHLLSDNVIQERL